MFVVVTLAGVWFGYYDQLDVTAERRSQAGLSMQMNGGSFGFTPKPESAFPWMLRLLCEKPETLLLMRWEPADNYGDIHPIPEGYLDLVKRVDATIPRSRRLADSDLGSSRTTIP